MRQEIDKKAKEAKTVGETLRVDLCVYVNARQDRRRDIPVSAADEFCSLALATRHCPGMGFGGLRITETGGRDGRPLTSRGPEILLIGFESRDGHTID